MCIFIQFTSSVHSSPAAHPNSCKNLALFMFGFPPHTLSLFFVLLISMSKGFCVTQSFSPEMFIYHLFIGQVLLWPPNRGALTARLYPPHSPLFWSWTGRGGGLVHRAPHQSQSHQRLWDRRLSGHCHPCLPSQGQ